MISCFQTSAKNELIFDTVPLEPGTTMTVFHCPVASCNKRNYLDSKSVRTHARRVHGMIDYEGTPSLGVAQYICQVRGCRKLFMEQVIQKIYYSLLFNTSHGILIREKWDFPPNPFIPAWSLSKSLLCLLLHPGLKPFIFT